jgi:hypothetical protein
MIRCTEVQEKIAWGLVLALEDCHHTAECSACTAVAAGWSRLQELMDESPVVVPDGFADRVMARLGDETPHVRRLLDERWVQIGLTHVGALVTLANLVRFVAALLVPSTSLGTP